MGVVPYYVTSRSEDLLNLKIVSKRTIPAVMQVTEKKLKLIADELLIGCNVYLHRETAEIVTIIGEDLYFETFLNDNEMDSGVN